MIKPWEKISFSLSDDLIDFQNFKIDHWRKLSDKINDISHSVEEYFVDDFKQILALIVEITNTEKTPQEIVGSAEVVKFINETFLINTVRNLFNQKYFYDKKLKEISNLIIEMCAYYAIKHFRTDNIKLLELLKLILEHDKIYYRNLDDSPNVLDNAYMIPDNSPEHLEFLSNLKKDDYVDVFICERKSCCWSRGKIKYMYNDSMKIEYLFSKDYKEYKRNSPMIAKYKTKSTDFDWRLELKEGDEIDYYDYFNGWGVEKIVDDKIINQGKDDEIRIIYIERKGYYQRREDVEVISPNIQKKGTITSNNTSKNYNNQCKDEYDDYFDIMITPPDDKILTILRPNLIKAELYENILKIFTEKGCFEYLIERISNQTEWCPIETVSAFINIIGVVYPFIHKEGIKQYLPKLKDAVFDNILKSSESNLRNMSKEKIDSIFKILKEAMKRVKSESDLSKIFEYKELEIALLLFNSEILKNKLQGLKLIVDIMKDIKDKRNSITFHQELREILENNKLLEKVFGAQGHSQLVQRSKELFQFLLQEGLMQNSDIDLIWESTRRGDKELKISVYKIIQDSNKELKKFIEKITDKLKLIKIKDLLEEDIELIYTLNYSLSAEDNQRTVYLLWEWVCSSHKLPDELAKFLVLKFSEIMRYPDMKDIRSKIMIKSIDALATAENIPILLETIRKNMDNSFGNLEFNIKIRIIKEMQDKKLLNTLVERLGKIKADILKDNPVIDNESIEIKKYIKIVTSVIDFWRYVVKTGECSDFYSFENICLLWDELVVRHINQSEKNLMYEVLQETLRSSAYFKLNDDISVFIRERMCHPDNITHMTIELWNSFQNLFFYVNERNENIENVRISTTRSFVCCGDSERTNIWEFDYKTRILPSAYICIDNFWTILYYTHNEAVFNQAMNLLIKLYTSLVNERDLPNFYEEYLSICVNKLQEMKTLEGLKHEQRSLIIVRCIKLIKQIIFHSEKNGVGCLKPHINLVKGELMTIHIENTLIKNSGKDSTTLTFKIYSNMSLFELKVDISKELNIDPNMVEAVKLYRNTSQEILDIYNGHTVNELKIKNGETLIAKKEPSYKEHKEIFVRTKNNTLSDGCIKALKEVFSRYCNQNQLMEETGLIEFTKKCYRSNSVEPRQIKDFIEKWDADRDGMISEKEFLNFYSRTSKTDSIWKNLHDHGYGPDFRLYTDPEIEEKVLPRFTLTSNNHYFNVLFNLLDENGPIAIEAWNLLSRLPTSPDIYKQIVGFKNREAKGTSIWEEILSSESKYKLSYSLLLIESLIMEENDSENSKKEKNRLVLFGINDASLEQLKNNWQYDFISEGGFDYLLKIFNQISKDKLSNMDLSSKLILSIILKIFKNYLTAVYSSQVRNLYRTMQFIGLIHLSLDSISDYLDQHMTSSKLGMERKISMELETVRKDSYAESDLPLNKKGSLMLSEEVKKKMDKIEETYEFTQLVEKMSGSWGIHILEIFDSKELLLLLSTLLKELTSSVEDLEYEDRMIVEYALCLEAVLILSDKEASNLFFSKSICTNAIMQGLYYKNNINIRKYYSHTIYLICRESLELDEANDTAERILDLMLQFLPTPESKPSIRQNESLDYTQFYELLGKILEDLYSPKRRRARSELLESRNFSMLCQTIIQTLYSHRSIEKRFNPRNDKVLIGLLNLSEKIFSIKPELKFEPTSQSIVLKIFNNFLFETRDISKIQEFQDFYGSEEDEVNYEVDYIKCKTEDSRKAAFKLLISLCRDCPTNMNTLIEEGVFKLINDTNFVIPSSTSNNGRDQRSPFGYLGIKNLGCICYMIAMLQQFFLNPTFRYGILMIDDKIGEKLAEKDNRLIDDNFLHQLQRMFTFLEMSDRSDFNPFEFCFSFKDFQGLPVNVSVQQDSQEFINNIFDKIENGTKNSPLKHLAESVYGGKTSTLLKCEECKNVKKKEENFYNLSLEVKNQKSLSESLEHFIKGEVISDYQCDKCNKKVTTIKQACLSSLPNCLIVHLQRIVFNLETFLNEKLNSKLDFPFDLDLEPYTLETLEKKEKSSTANAEEMDSKANEIEADSKVEFLEIPKKDEMSKDFPNKKEENSVGQIQRDKNYYKYRLIGVVCHTGTADYGHYYSYIDVAKDRSHRGENVDERWLEFNDSIVKEFDKSNIDNECFGGGSEQQYLYDDYYYSKRDYSKNAYILVYDRLVKEDVKVAVEKCEKEDLDKLNKSIGLKLEPQEITIEEPVDMESETKVDESESKPKPDAKLAEKVESVSYFNFKKFIPQKYFKEVWLDNHKFMCERHLYNEDFLKFFNDLIVTLKPPQLSLESKLAGFNVDYDSISKQDRENLEKMIKLVQKFFEILPKTQNNAPVIEDMTNKLREFSTIIPDKSFDILENLLNISSVLDLLFSNSNQSIRDSMSKLLVHLINIIIKFYSMTLDKNILWTSPDDLTLLQKKESKLLNLLDNLLTAIHTEVQKNSHKYEQYFEFWQEFAKGGDTQMRYLFEREIISILIDFYLDKKSPLNKSADKRTIMGYVSSSSSSSPNYLPIINLLSTIISKNFSSEKGVPPKFQLSNNDRICLFCQPFYQKLFDNLIWAQTISGLIRHLTPHFPEFIFCFFLCIIKELRRISDELTLEPYLEAIYELLKACPDNNTIYGVLEWLIGYPSQKMQSTIEDTVTVRDLDFPNEKRYKTFKTVHFGIYGIFRMDEPIFSYSTTLNMDSYYQQPILELIMKRNRGEFNTMIFLKHLFTWALNDERIFLYLLDLEPTQCYHGNCFSWVKDHISDFNKEDRRDYNSTSRNIKEELSDKVLQLYDDFDEKQKKLIQSLYDYVKEEMIKAKEIEGILDEDYKPDAAIEDCFKKFVFYDLKSTVKAKILREIRRRPVEQQSLDNMPHLSIALEIGKTRIRELYIVGQTQNIKKEVVWTWGNRDLLIWRVEYDIATIRSLPVNSRNLSLPSEYTKNPYYITNIEEDSIYSYIFKVNRYENRSRYGYGDDSAYTDDNKSENETAKNIFEFSINKYVRKYYLDNRTNNKNVVCKINFIYPKGKPVKNMRKVLSPIFVYAKSGSESVIVILHKFDPTEPWDQYELKVECAVFDESYFSSEFYCAESLKKFDTKLSFEFVEEEFEIDNTREDASSEY